MGTGIMAMWENAFDKNSMTQRTEICKGLRKKFFVGPRVLRIFATGSVKFAAKESPVEVFVLKELLCG
jgi:hypothetical protein